MAVAGLRGTGDWGTDERPKSFREMILRRNPNGRAPLTALMSKMRKESVDDPQFSWWEEAHNPIRLLVNGAVTTAQVTVTIDGGDAQDLVAGDVLLVEKTETTAYDNEIIVVSAVASSTQFTVTRGQAGTTAGTIVDNSYLTKIGNVFSEGSTSPNSSTRNPTKYTNYCQIFKTSYELTNTAVKNKVRTGDPLKNDKIRKMFDHSVALEFASLFGKPYETTGANGKPLRYTGGLMHFLATAYAAGDTSCMTIWTTTPTEDEFVNAVYKVWDYEAEGAGNERIVLAGNGFLNSLNRLARSATNTRINFNGTVDVYGMKLQEWVFPQGTLYIRTHPLMNVHPRFTNSAFVINPGAVRWRPHTDRDTKHQDNIQANDADTRKGQWITEGGCEFNHMVTMTYLGNFIK